MNDIQIKLKKISQVEVAALKEIGVKLRGAPSSGAISGRTLTPIDFPPKDFS
jgi:hypothetical protein